MVILFIWCFDFIDKWMFVEEVVCIYGFDCILLVLLILFFGCGFIVY